MCRPDSQEQPLKLVDFDRGLAMETIDQNRVVFGLEVYDDLE
jgi:hypothetical protein